MYGVAVPGVSARLEYAALQSPRPPGWGDSALRRTISALKSIKRAQKERMQPVIMGGLGPAMNTNRCYMGEAGKGNELSACSQGRERGISIIHITLSIFQVTFLFANLLSCSTHAGHISHATAHGIINYDKPSKNSILINSFRSVPAFYPQSYE